MTHDKTLHICYTINDRFVDLCCSSIYSIIRRKDPETEIQFYVLGDRLSNYGIFEVFNQVDKIHVNVYKIDSSDFMHGQDVSNSPGTIAWVRFMIPRFDVFQHLHRILYIDSDFFARQDVSPVYHAELRGYPLGMVKDATGVHHKDVIMPWPEPEYKTRDFYCNNGLMLMDLDKFRKHQWPERLMYASLHRESPRMNDQHVVSNIMHWDTCFLPPTFQLSYHNFIRTPDSLVQYVDRWNNYFGTKYDSVDELIRASYFWHFHENKQEHLRYPLLKFIMETFMNDMLEFRKTGVVKPWSPEEDEPFYAWRKQ